MLEKKPKVPETKVKEPNFIKFSEIQTKYLNEVRNRQLNEFNEVLESVYKELGIIEKLKQAPPGTYKLRMQDLSGLDIIPPPRKPDLPPPDPPKGDKPSGKNGKDK